MNTHTSSSGPRPGATTPGRLARSATDRHIAGVAGGLGEHFGIDPTLVRIAFIILTVLGGSGVALYLLAWVMLPAADQPESMASSLLHHQPGHPWPRQAVVLGAIAAVLVLGAVDHPHHFGLLGPMLIVALIALWVTRRNDSTPFPPAGPNGPPFGWHPPPGPTPPPPPAPRGPVPTDGGPADAEAADPTVSGPSTPEPPTAEPGMAGPAMAGPTGEHPAGADPTLRTAVIDAGSALGDPFADPFAGMTWDNGPDTWPLPVAPMPVAVPAARSGVTAATIAVALLGGGVLLLDATGIGHVGAYGFFAAALTLTGAGLVVSAWRGRAWGLVPVAFLLVGALGVTAATGSVRGGIGDRTFHPAGAADVRSRYDLAAGEMDLNLGDVHPVPGQVTRVKADVAAGHLLVTVPTGERVTVKASSGAGVVQLFDRTRSGTSVDMSATDEPVEGTGTIALDLHAGFGGVECVVLRDAGKGFLTLGLLCMVLGVVAMIGAALPGWALLRWGTPVVLLGLGLLGLARHRPTRRPTDT